jgi:hypothetical protein
MSSFSSQEIALIKELASIDEQRKKADSSHKIEFVERKVAVLRKLMAIKSATFENKRIYKEKLDLYVQMIENSKPKQILVSPSVVFVEHGLVVHPRSNIHIVGGHAIALPPGIHFHPSGAFHLHHY